MMSFNFISNFLTNNTDISVLFLMHLFFIQKRYISVIILNILILIGLITGVDKILCLEMSAMLSIYSLTLHNRRFKITSITSIIFLSCGCFLLALKEVNQQFIENAIKSIPYIDKYSNLVQDLYFIVALLFIIGLIPFTEWAMYLFSISSSLFKIVCFITPMFVNLKILCDMVDSISFASLQIVGYIISIYSCVYIIFNKNIRSICVYIITYFYGMEISHINNLDCNTFISIVLAMLLFSNTLVPVRTVKYNISTIKYIIPTVFSKVLFVSSMCIIFYCFVCQIFAQHIKSDRFNIITLSLFSVFFSKTMSYFSVNNQVKENKQQYINLPQSRMIRMAICNLLLIYFFYQTSSLSMFQNQDVIVISAVILTFLTTFVFFTLTNTYIKINMTKSKTYSQFLLKLLSCFKIVILIIQNIFIDFSNSIKDKVLKLSISSIPKKVSNILYEQNIYFYIFFLIQIIVVLTIECVII